MSNSPLATYTRITKNKTTTETTEAELTAEALDELSNNKGED